MLKRAVSLKDAVINLNRNTLAQKSYNEIYIELVPIFSAEIFDSKVYLQVYFLKREKSKAKNQ